MRHPARYTLVATALICSAASLVACGGGDSSTSGSVEQLPFWGVVSPQSSSFQKYSGDGPGRLRLAEFGGEASRGERNEAKAVVVPYLKAINAGEWRQGCRYLSGLLLAQIEEISRNAKQEVEPSCPEVLRALVVSAGRESGAPLVLASHGVASLRIKEDPHGGFALFHGADGKDYYLTVIREGGSWGVTALAPASLPLSR